MTKARQMRKIASLVFRGCHFANSL